MISTDDIVAGTANYFCGLQFHSYENAKVGLHVKQNKHVIFLPSSRITKILGLRTPGLMDGKRE